MKPFLISNSILLLSLFSSKAVVADSDILGLIDTRVGTTFATTKTAGKFGKGSEEHGQTLPAVGVSHGMNLWTPQTRDTEKKCIAPYYYSDSLLQGFRNSHWIVGGCTQDYGSATLHAMSGELRSLPESRATRMDKASEVARPDYYSVYLPDEALKAEMTGLSRSGIFRFTYDKSGKAHLVANPNSDEAEGSIVVDTLRHEIRGHNPVHRIYQGWGEPAGFAGWFVFKYPDNLKVTEFGTFTGDSTLAGRDSLSNQPGIGAYITFEAEAGVPVEVKAASSFTSLANARMNMNRELFVYNFDSVRRQSARQWLERLNKIEVEGGTDNDLAKFYGSLYRCSLLPRVVSDVDGSYPAFAGGSPVMKMPAGHDYYDDYSMWDTYRALHPLLTIIDPIRSADMMQSLLLKARQGGWMPIFPCWGSYTAAMIGDHCAATLADAAVKGIGGFDLKEAYKYLRKNAFESPKSFAEYEDGMGRRALKSYIKYGYIPVEDPVEEAFHQNEQTSRTLEYAFDDYTLSRLAELVGEHGDAARLLARSRNYRNVIDPATGYANGRHADGRFVEGTNPFDFNKAITEGAPCHYTWYVPHDPEGLVEALGGAEMFEAKLDSMFTEHRYWHGNEPCHQVAYLFNAVNRPDKTRKWVRYIMDTEYLNEPGGLSGNDDAGQMSAWYVFTALGFYPVCPASGEYWLGAPAFDKITVHAGGNPFVITSGNVGTNESPTLGNAKVGNLKITHQDIVNGGSLKF